jgi:hypothetical protein
VHALLTYRQPKDMWMGPPITAPDVRHGSIENSGKSRKSYVFFSTKPYR